MAWLTFAPVTSNHCCCCCCCGLQAMFRLDWGEVSPLDKLTMTQAQIKEKYIKRRWVKQVERRSGSGISSATTQKQAAVGRGIQAQIEESPIKGRYVEWSAGSGISPAFVQGESWLVVLWSRRREQRGASALTPCCISC